MEQNNYKYNILLLLTKGKKHIREISRLLNTNHMNIVRKTKELVDENVLDYEQEGKNKVFFIKKTHEAKQYLEIAEKYKLVNAITKYPILRDIFNEIQKDNSINLAILFGSYAKDKPKESSDIDIYVYTKNINTKRNIEKMNSKLSVKIGDYDRKNLTIKEIENNHVIIKGVELFYEKNEFFEEVV